MKTSLFVVFCFIVFVSAAQKVVPENIKPDSLHYKIPFFSFYPIILNNGEKLKNSEAVVLFRKVPEADTLYNGYRTKYKVGLYSFAGMFAGCALSAVSFDKGKHKSLVATGLILSLAAFINAIVFIASGEANLKKAIRFYNGY